MVIGSCARMQLRFGCLIPVRNVIPFSIALKSTVDFAAD